MYRILCDSYVLYDPRLPDLFVFEPDLTQKKNEPGELTFTIPKEHPYYGVLEKLKSRIKVYRDDTLIWVSWLMRQTGVWDDRKNCDGLWALCDMVARNELIAGDFLFRNNTTNANDETHVGLYLGRGMVIHAKGRDVGVVVEGINQGGSGYWHKCGRCKLLYQ